MMKAIQFKEKLDQYLVSHGWRGYYDLVSEYRATFPAMSLKWEHGEYRIYIGDIPFITSVYDRFNDAATTEIMFPYLAEQLDLHEYFVMINNMVAEEKTKTLLYEHEQLSRMLADVTAQLDSVTFKNS
jgi:hypothetical protein